MLKICTAVNKVKGSREASGRAESPKQIALLPMDQRKRLSYRSVCHTGPLLQQEQNPQCDPNTANRCRLCETV